MKKMRAAIVGLGRIASRFAEDPKRTGVSTHAQAYLAQKGVELAAACDLNRENLEGFGSRWGVKGLYDDFGKMMREAQPDIVSVCTWNSTHEKLVREAVRGGVKAVICEKPLADSLAGADRMIALCKRAGVPLLVNYSRRYNADHRRLARWVAAGGLGKIQAASCFYTAGLMNTGTHLFDELRLFLGEVKSVLAFGAGVAGGADPTLDLVLQFENGPACAIHALDVKEYLQFEMDLYGTRGRLRIENSGMHARVWKIIPHPVFSGYRTLAADRSQGIDLSQNLLGLVSNAVDCARGKAKPFCSGGDGRAAMEVAFAAHESLRSDKRFFLPLKNRNRMLESK